MIPHIDAAHPTLFATVHAPFKSTAKLAPRAPAGAGGSANGAAGPANGRSPGLKLARLRPRTSPLRAWLLLVALLLTAGVARAAEAPFSVCASDPDRGGACRPAEFREVDPQGRRLWLVTPVDITKAP